MVEKDEKKVEPGKFVLVKYVGKRSVAGYVGEILEKVGDEWRVDFYTPGNLCEARGARHGCHRGQIVAVLPKPSSAGTTARTLGSINFSIHPEAIGNADLRQLKG